MEVDARSETREAVQLQIYKIQILVDAPLRTYAVTTGARHGG